VLPYVLVMRWRKAMATCTLFMSLALHLQESTPQDQVCDFLRTADFHHNVQQLATSFRGVISALFSNDSTRISDLPQHRSYTLFRRAAGERIF
jgi:hypothetical protein